MTAAAKPDPRLGLLRLEELYERHFRLGKRFYREPSRAVGWETCLYLWYFLADTRPRSILDMGAGLSTAVIRLYRQICQPHLVTWTTDHLKKWLAVAEIELIRDALPHDHMYLQEHLEHEDAISLVPPFPVIFFDLNGLDGRIERVDLVDRWLAPGGTLLLDDWHHSHYRIEMRAALEARGFAVESLPSTEDEFGRFLARATRIEDPDGAP